LDKKRKNLILPPTTLPVLATCDVVIAGGGYGACALALNLAKQGLQVVVVESRTYLGWETGALLRPWISRQVLEHTPDLFAPWIQAANGPTLNPQELALHPDLCKRGLEDVLLAAGVRLFYFSWAVGLVRQGDAISGMVVANKSGRQAILARAVVDATDRAVLARQTLGHLPPECPAAVRAARTVEFTGVKKLEAPLPEGEGIRQVLVHGGHAGLGHVLLECAMDLPFPSADDQGRMALELEARRRTFAYALKLVGSHPAFSKAWLAAMSWECTLGSPFGFISSWYYPSEPNFFFTNPNGLLLDPLTAAMDGDQMAALVAKVASEFPAPQAGSCTASCGQPAKGKLSFKLGELKQPQRGRDWEQVSLPSEEVPILAKASVAVAGGGTSGATASAVAAREGAPTVCLDPNSGLGGTGTVGGVDSYWYGRKVGFTAELDARYAERAGKLKIPAKGVWNVEARLDALLDWNLESGAQVFFRSLAVGALMEGKAVQGLLVATPDGLKAVEADVTIDASGDGDVAVQAGAEFIYGSSRDRIPMWYSMAPLIKPGKPQNNFTSTVDVSNVEDYTRAILAARRRWDGHDHVTYLCPRESRHILGETLLTLDDQLALRQYPDVVNLCFSNSDIKGKSSADWLLWGLLPPNVETEIPYRALIPQKVDGLLIAGKAYSCVHDFLALARMQADMQNQGGVCALAAVLAMRKKVQPRAVDVPTLQKGLVKAGVLPAALAKRRVKEGKPGTKEWQAWVDSVTGKEPLYLRQGFKDATTEPWLLIRIAQAPAGIVPVLEAAHAGASGSRKFMLARLLAWHQSKSGLETLLEAMRQGIAATTLPGVTRNVMYAGVAPDQAVMPEPCYLLYTLGMVPDAKVIPILKEVADKYHAGLEDFRDKAKGPFYWVDAVCYVAERLGLPEAVAPLKVLHANAILHGHTSRQPQPDFMLERLAFLEMALGRAMARCGERQGFEILAGYLNDSRAILAEHAQDELEAISGKEFGKDEEAWLKWLKGQRTLQPKPWKGKIL
jgi:glycine/D-amino acid oxidase-like deaminating enzyme